MLQLVQKGQTNYHGTKRKEKLLLPCFKGMVRTCEICFATFKGRAKGKSQRGSGRNKCRKWRGGSRLCVRTRVWSLCVFTAARPVSLLNSVLGWFWCDRAFHWAAKAVLLAGTVIATRRKFYPNHRSCFLEQPASHVIYEIWGHLKLGCRECKPAIFANP